MQITTIKIHSNMKTEIWRDIEGYEGMYQVSNHGRVKSLGNNKRRKEKVLKPDKTKTGNSSVVLSKNTSKRKYVHTLVANAFIPNKEKLPQVFHIDLDNSNNHVDNLKWCTDSENKKKGDAQLRRAMKTSRPVVQYDMQGNEINRFYGISEAGRQTNIKSHCIWFCCRGIQKSTGGFIWKYDLDTNNQNPF